MPPITWQNANQMEPRAYTCAFCGKHTGPNLAFFSNNTNPQARIYICTYCGAPTYFDTGQKQHPGNPFGRDVEALPADVQTLFGDARRCMTVNSFTPAVLTCRKLLMHIAVEKGAEKDKSFLYYVEYLAAKGYVPPGGEAWVDHIREKGNEANHEIKIMSEADAQDLITFSEMLLRFIYEFPSKVRPSSGVAKKP